MRMSIQSRWKKRSVRQSRVSALAPSAAIERQEIMRHDTGRRLLLTKLGLAAGAGAGALALVRAAYAGPCDTGSPLVGPTGKSLQDVYDKIARTDDGLAEARTPVESLSGSATAQYIISAPGAYYLTGNITGVAGKAAIEIQADHVELECDGFTFIGVAGTLACIVVPSVQRCIGIFDAGFRGWLNTCIDLRNATESLVEECWFDACDSTTNAAAIGTCALGAGGVVFDCDVRSCHGSLVSVGQHGVIEECTNVNGDGGCFFSVGDAVMEDNFAMQNSGTGFTIQDRGVVIGNRLVNVGGIDAGAGSVVSENDIGNAPGAAITVRGARCCVEENYIANGPTGIAVLAAGGETLVDGNQIVGVTSDGVTINASATGCFVIRNCVRGTGTAYTIPAGNAYGPLTNVAGAGDISAIAGANHPWANFVY